MMKIKLKFPLIWAVLLLLPLFCLAQTTNTTLTSGDSLLEQYLFPVSSFLESGNPIVKAGAECDNYSTFASGTPGSWLPGVSCLTLNDTGSVQKITNGNGVFATGLTGLTYKIAVTNEGTYNFKIKAANSFDDFTKLTNQQLDYIFDNSVAATSLYDSYQINDNKSLIIKEYSDINVIPETEKYQLFKSLVFSVYLDMPADTVTSDEPNYRKGFIILPATDYTQLQEGSALLGNLQPGEHTVTLHFLSDYFFDYSSLTLPSYLNNFDNVNLKTGVCLDGANINKTCQTDNDCPESTCQKTKTIDINPVIASVALDTTVPTMDVVGIRIYTNKDHKDAATWYKENVISPSASVTPIKVDGYLGVQDDRTVYVSAANIVQYMDGGVVRSNFFTNMYVIAYNQQAAPNTLNIFKQMLGNWKFNKNIMQDKTLQAAELEKDKLRRDVIRLEDLYKLGLVLDSYKSGHNGLCPVLDAGTYIKNHSISTWPSWQATLGNELGTALPVDPLNIMSTTMGNQYDCTNDVDKDNCQNICSRDNSGNALKGCPANQQCVADYCSMCGAEYDPLTCWDNTNLKFFDTDSSTGKVNVFSGCNDIYNGGLKIGASDCTNGLFSNGSNYYNNGAFVYQYVSSPDAKQCSFINRFEYTQESTCPPGSCYFDNNDNNPNNDCYQPGSCLAGCDSLGENCVNNDYKNLYCYLGGWKQSCGDGFSQSQCGEACDPNATNPTDASWCDALFGPEDWYNESGIKATCSSSCTISGSENLTLASCGGYCGDKVVEAEGGEECDEGSVPALMPKGKGGFNQNSQYWCSGKSGGAKPIVNGVDCDNYSTSWDQAVTIACTALPDPGTNVWVSKPTQVDDTYITSLGGFRASYDFNLTQPGGYNLQITAANNADDLTKLTREQLDLLFFQKQNITTLYNITGEGGLDIPEYGQVGPEDSRKYDLLKSLIFSVYLDTDNTPESLKGFIMVPASNLKQTGSLFINNLSAGNHTVFLHFVGDHFYVPGITANSVLAPLADVASGLPNATELDINPVLYDVSLYSPNQAIGKCKTYGGWCGDGVVQVTAGEQCDTKNYYPPTPEQSVNIVRNSGFEGYFTPWQKISGNVSLDGTQYFAGYSSLKLTGAAAELQQASNFLEDKNYNISLRLKGNVDSVKFQVGSQTEITLLENEAEKKADWKLYKFDNFTATASEQFKLTFTPVTATALNINIDDINIIAEASARLRYQCGTDTATGSLCQFSGGYCGDGTIQRGFGENCDDRVGLSCAGGEGCGISGTCNVATQICQSVSCNNYCKSTYCGDGVVQRPNSQGVYEICDPKIDPLCDTDCQHIRMGGSCSQDTYDQTCQPNDTDGLTCRTCSSGLSCSIRNFGDTDRVCLGARDTYGCKKNDDCILGYYCNVRESKCVAEISTYLGYHSAPQTSLTLPLPVDPIINYDINISKCPDLKEIYLGNETYLVDRCTGVQWQSTDNITKIDANWSYNEAKTDACAVPSRLPTVAELYSLVRQTDSGLLYADKTQLKLCGVGCDYDEGDTDLCADSGCDDNYLYWTNTCVEGTEDACTKALAVNFKYGSIEVYNTTANLKVRCLKDVECGNGTLETGESCEFFTSAGGELIEKNVENEYQKTCGTYGYDGGFLHCDTSTCGIRVDNCYLNSQVNQSCADLCLAKKALGCRSVGLNVGVDSFLNNGATAIISNDNKMIDLDANGYCFVRDITVENKCNYEFVDRGQSCIDTLNSSASANNSEFSYCNCEEITQ